MPPGICGAGISRVCAGAEKRLCLRCPLFMGNNPAGAAVSDIEDLVATQNAGLCRRRVGAARRKQRVFAIESTVLLPPSPSGRGSAVKLSTTMGLETDGPPASKAATPFIFPSHAKRGAALTQQRRAASGAPLVLPQRRRATDSAAAGKVVSFSSDEGRRMFAEALCDGHGESYFRLSEQYQTLTSRGDEEEAAVATTATAATEAATDDAEVAESGAECLTMVLNAMRVDPMEAQDVVAGESPVWKGIWRWFSSDMLEKHSDSCGGCGRTAEKALQSFACLASRALKRRDDCRVATFSKAGTDLAAFRVHVKYAAASTATFMTPLFDKQTVLAQEGAPGTERLIYSPVAGYHEATDSVLILDVDRRHTTPYWVPLNTLYESVTEGYCVFASDGVCEESGSSSSSDLTRLVRTLGDEVCASGGQALLGVQSITSDTAERLRQTHAYTCVSNAAGTDPVLTLAITALLVGSRAGVFTHLLNTEQRAAFLSRMREDQDCGANPAFLGQFDRVPLTVSAG